MDVDRLLPRKRFVNSVVQEREIVLTVEGKKQPCDGAGTVRPVLQRERSTVRFRNLAAENKANTGPPGLGRKEWNKDVSRVGNPWTFVLNPQFKVSPILLPANAEPTLCFEGCFRGVSDKVDQELIELVRVHADG
jgi:hypothetical protein